ncbi:MAG TPA: MBL fold metallo-hydrolase [Desulfuromonadales bacterium]|nr:MBL fold metallo-hydrolase [Desulfuromonadales bacterium]
MDRRNLTCIDLDQPDHEGFRRFISSWLYRDKRLGFLVDPGPLSTIPHLLAELDKAGVERLDLILLTHIHIDHAGGTGALLDRYPEAKVVCHPDGIPHMIDPAQLWQGSLKVLGDLARTFGEIIPVAAGRIGCAELLAGTGLRMHRTPGHAPHHVCYQMEDLLFGGEVAGVRAEVPQGIYMRPATPPRFVLEVAVDSLERMLALEPRSLIIAHHGLVEPASDYLRIARGQLQLWVRGVIETASKDTADSEQELFDWLLGQDRHFRNFEQLPADIQARERYFFGNTCRGLQDYADRLSSWQKQGMLRKTA